MHKITQPLFFKSRNLSTKKKHCENRKTRRWDHLIGSQMCQITLSKRTEQFKKISCMIFYCHCCHFYFSKFFWKELFDTFDNICDVLRAAFCNSRDVFICATICTCWEIQCLQYAWISLYRPLKVQSKSCNVCWKCKLIMEPPLRLFCQKVFSWKVAWHQKVLFLNMIKKGVHGAEKTLYVLQVYMKKKMSKS